MTCDRRRLSYYLDGELSPEEEAAVRAHLRECATCRADLAAYQRIGQAIRNQPIPPMPAGFAGRVYSQIEREQASRRLGLTGWLGRAFPAAVVAALVVGFSASLQRAAFPIQSPAASAVPSMVARAVPTPTLAIEAKPAAATAEPAPTNTPSERVPSVGARVGAEAPTATTGVPTQEPAPTVAPAASSGAEGAEAGAEAGPAAQGAPPPPSVPAARPAQAEATAPPATQPPAPQPAQLAPAPPASPVAAPSGGVQSPVATTSNASSNGRAQQRQEPDHSRPENGAGRSAPTPAPAASASQPTVAATAPPAPPAAAPGSPAPSALTPAPPSAPPATSGAGAERNVGGARPAAAGPAPTAGAAAAPASTEPTTGPAAPARAETGRPDSSQTLPSAAVVPAATSQPALGAAPAAATSQPAPSQSPAAAPPTPAAEPTAPAGLTPSSEPAPPTLTPTAGETAPAEPPLAVAAPFQSALSGDQAARLGAPTAAAANVGVVIQPFENGLMLRRSDSSKIYVLARQNGHWSAQADPWSSGDVEPSDDPAVPKKGFGKLWRDNSAIHKALGNPTGAERSASWVAQTFQNGVAISSGGTVYVLYADGTWSST